MNLKQIKRYRKKLAKFILKKYGYNLVRSSKLSIEKEKYSEILIAYEHMFSILQDVKIEKDSLRYDLLTSLQGTSLPEAYFIIKCLIDTIDVDGDICEFGVAQGFTSSLIANEIRGYNKKLHLFDSFEGLPEASPEDELKDDIFNLEDIRFYKGKMKYPKEMVKERLHKIQIPGYMYRIHKGYIESIINDHNNKLPESVSFAYVDFDFYGPIKTTLEYLHPILSSRGIILVDDYSFFSTGVKKAVDRFVLDKKDNYKINCPSNTYGHFIILEKVR